MTNKPFRPEDFSPTAASGPQFEWLSDRLTLHSQPLNRFGITFKERVRAFQLAQGWQGAGADGYVGPETLKRLTAEPKVPTPAIRIPTDRWKLTTPLWNGKEGEDKAPLEIFPIKDFSKNPWYAPQKDGSIRLRANAGGSHTPNSFNSRCEYREVEEDGTLSKWDSHDGVERVIEGTFRILHLPEKVPSVVPGQFHNKTDDIFMLNCVGNEDRDYVRIMLLESLGKNKGSKKHLLFSAWRVDQPISYRMSLGPEGFNATVNGNKIDPILGFWEDVYRKAGIYLQTNVSKGEKPDAFGELEYLELNIFDL